MTGKLLPHTANKSVLKLTFEDNELLKILLGERDTNLKIIEKKIGAQIHVRGNQVTISGEVEKIAGKLGIKHISVSITHTANFAIASAVALTERAE